MSEVPTVTLDARRQKMDLFRAYQAQEPVQGLILGSSRTMKLDPQVFGEATGQRFFNFTVDAARAEDYLAVYRKLSADPDYALGWELALEDSVTAPAYDCLLDLNFAVPLDQPGS